jgi:hypothetical protein
MIQLLDTELIALVGESYNRAYLAITTAQVQSHWQQREKSD